MTIPDIFAQLPTDDVVRRVFGEPFRTADGATLIAAARIRGGGGGDGLTATPLGMFVIRGEKASWVGAVDMNRIALVGVITGLVAAVIGTLAVLRRPPWPDLRGWPRQGL